MSYEINSLESFNDSLIAKSRINNTIHPEKYKINKIKHGLRNSNGTGVLVGITGISNVEGYTMSAGEKVPSNGRLSYRGYDVFDLINDDNLDVTYEMIVYLLLIGELPNKEELDGFNKLIDIFRTLPNGYTKDMILNIPSSDIMNKLQRSVLVLYSHDNDPDDLSIENLLFQCIKLIARFPTIISYSYQAKAHYFDKKSLYIHKPLPGIGTAKNILGMIRPDSSYTNLESETLDLLLILHADHGGGNNSAFATHVVSSSGTDTYSAISAAVGSLKGPKHGGANNRVRNMIIDIKNNVNDLTNDEEIENYLIKIINKNGFDNSGLIYGLGHAVYTLSDPRSVILRKKAKALAIEKAMTVEFEFYSKIESIGVRLLFDMKGKTVCSNVDLYSGLVYEMLNIPHELYTPLFATARIAGWSAHRIEQVMSDNKIIRPAYIFNK